MKATILAYVVTAPFFVFYGLTVWLAERGPYAAAFLYGLVWLAAYIVIVKRKNR